MWCNVMYQRMNKSISTPVDCSERGIQKLGMVSVAVLCCVGLCSALGSEERERRGRRGEGRGREGGDRRRERERGREGEEGSGKRVNATVRT